ncbi:MAG: HlyD family efflux transporter periplasmic adaptor subunit [Clostridia bacterium]|nr:HlyD family efflux transporter periplasmic adaptor subunit [Clostridia bacterium]
MKNMMISALLALMLLMPVCAAAEGISLDGQIEAVMTRTIAAPHTGIVGDFAVRVGDELAAGETLFTLSATKIYADFDGRITGLFAQPGDNAASVQDRYSALCYMEREERYTAQCSTSGGDNDNENKMIHVGEIVYLKSTANDDRKGVARITWVEDRSYNLDVLSEKDMRLGEQFKVFREDDYDSEDCIGSGKLKRINPTPVTAEGYVRAVHIEEGQEVARGDLLFEIVPDALEGMRGSDGSVMMPDSGVVLSVLCESGAEIAKDAPMATWCARADMQLVCEADEEDLAGVFVGQEVVVTLDAMREAPVKGVVVKIASAGEGERSSVGYDVTIALDEDTPLRVGMNATAEFE